MKAAARTPAAAVLLWLLLIHACAQVPLALAGSCALFTLLWCFVRRPGRSPAAAPGVLRPSELAVGPRRRRVLAGAQAQCQLGSGGDWTVAHTQALHGAGDPAAGLAAAPGRGRTAPVEVPVRLLERNVLALGAPGSGKSSLLVLLAWQAQQRGEAVVVLDPKASPALRASLAAGARAAGVPFLCLSAAAVAATRYDPFRHCEHAADFADRLCGLISDTRHDPFREFCRGAVTTLCEMLLALAERPTIARLAALLPDAGAGLLAEQAGLAAGHTAGHTAGPAFGLTTGPALGLTIGPTVGRMAGTPAESRSASRLGRALSALRVMIAHDRTHFRKLCAPLFPILNLLGSGTGAALLGTTGAGESTLALDLWHCRKQQATVYIGLDALAQPQLARALAWLLLDDLTREAAAAWQHSSDRRALQLMVDEAGEVACEPLLRLLGKGREAGTRVLLAVQTLSDLEWRLESVAAARVAFGNCAAWFLFRQLDAHSREESEARLGTLPVECSSHARAEAVASGQGHRRRSRSRSETRADRVLPRIPAATFAALLDFECLAHLPDGRLLHLRLPRPAWN